MEGISSGQVLLRMMLMRSAKEDEEPWALQDQAEFGMKKA